MSTTFIMSRDYFYHMVWLFFNHIMRYFIVSCDLFYQVTWQFLTCHVTIVLPCRVTCFMISYDLLYQVMWSGKKCCLWIILPMLWPGWVSNSQSLTKEGGMHTHDHTKLKLMFQTLNIAYTKAFLYPWRDWINWMNMTKLLKWLLDLTPRDRHLIRMNEEVKIAKINKSFEGIFCNQVTIQRQRIHLLKASFSQ